MQISCKPRVTGLFAKVNIVTKTQYFAKVSGHIFTMCLFILHTQTYVYI